ncbi:MAG: hypothetical protein ACUVQ8_03645 [Nitrososphaeria archaeon]
MTKQQRPPKNVIHQILEVLYAPHKAFKEIVQEPKYIGPILVLIIFMATSTTYGYTILSRSYIEQTLPNPSPFIGQFDVWTENATLWISAPGAEVAEDFNDFMNGSYYGNRSISFSMSRSSQIFMTLMGIGPVNCSGLDGYKNLSLRIKVVNPEIMPSSASIYLFSGQAEATCSQCYFSYNLTDAFSGDTAGIWKNLTIPLATKSWVASNGDWSNITGMELALNWPKDYNISVLVDGLYFRGVFKTPINIDATGYLLSYSLSSFLQFAIQWLLATAIIYMILRAFGAKTLWKPIFVSVGFAFIVLSVKALIDAAVVLSTLTDVYYTLEYLGGTATEIAAAAAKMGDQVSLFLTVNSYIHIAVFMWITALCAIANRLLTQLSWAKSFLASAIAIFVTYMISLLFGL